MIPAVLSIKSAIETPLPITIAPPETTDKKGFLLIHGMPRTASLSVGRLFESGVWGIRIAEIERLKILALPNAEGASQLKLSLQTLDGHQLAEVRSNLLIEAVQVTGSTRQLSAEEKLRTTLETAFASSTIIEPHSITTNSLSIIPQALSTVEKRNVLLLMSKASENIQQGKINIARLFYKRAAEKGWADAAIALAKTFEARELAKLNAPGILPDPVEAQRWYQRAKELGADQPEEYLK